MPPRTKAPPKQSAGVLMYRRGENGLEVLLAHPGGPFWATKEEGAWTIPKGEIEPGEEQLAAAIREVNEEIGVALAGPFVPLAPVTQKSGKIVHAFAAETDFDPTKLTSNMISIEWPPRSGRALDIPEIDRAGWFALDVARVKINAGQVPLLDELAARMTKG